MTTPERRAGCDSAGNGRAAVAGVCSGATLIEMLVGTVMMVVLGTLLFPIIGKARSADPAAHCLSNEKKIGVALKIYSEDYDHTTPPVRACSSPPKRTQGAGTENCECGAGNAATGSDGTYAALHDLVYPYHKDRAAYRCPAARKTGEGYPATADAARTPPDGNPSNLAWHYNVNYIYVRGNCPLATCPDNSSHEEYPWEPRCGWGRKLSSISQPAELIALVEGSANTPDIRLSIGGLRCRHNGGTNYLFADGHAKWHRFSQTLRPRFLWIDDGFKNARQTAAVRGRYETALRTAAAGSNLAECK